MNEELIPLNLIVANPYQPREKEDPEHVKKVALSIAEQGLLQTPVGRRVNGRVELAFGHTRLAAFKLLSSERLDQGFQHIPVILQDLSDQQLFEMAISENLARKDLSPIEEARAMLTYREKFGKKSAEIGKLFGLSDSAVRNKIRLLDLPEHVQAKVAENDLPEGVARGLVTLFSLPENLREAAEHNLYSSWHEKPSTIVRQTLAGEMNAEQLQNNINRIMDANAKDLGKAEWRLGWEREHNEFVATSCKDCPMRIKERNLCTDPECYKAKDRVWKADVLYLASQRTGIAVPEEPVYNLYTYEGGHADADWRAYGGQIRESGCENLRLAYDRDPYDYEKDAFLGKEGFPKVRVYCSKKTGHCSCLNGLKALKDKGDSPVQAASPEELQQAAKEERARVRSIRKRMNEIREAAIEELVMSFAAFDLGAWRWLAKEVDWQVKEKVMDKDLDGIFRAIAEKMVGDPGQWSGDGYYRWLLGEFKRYGLLVTPEMEVKDPE